MKTMKNVLMILLGAALVLSLAGVGAAETTAETTKKITEASNPNDGEFKVTYTIGESYSVTIPSDVTPSKTDEPTSTTFKVESAILGPTSKLVVNITSANGWKMKLGETGNEIPYTMYYNNDQVSVGNNQLVTICEIPASITTPEAVVTQSLSFKMNNPDGIPTVAGAYTDVLTITVTPTPTSVTQTPTPETPSEEGQA